MDNPTQKNINNLSKILNAIWIFLKEVIIELARDIKKLSIIFFKNIIKGTWSHKISTLILFSIAILPAIAHYHNIGGNVYQWYENKKNYTGIIAQIQSNGDKTIEIFFETYNKKYGIDCEWIRMVNVDENMYLKHGTEKKPGSGCLTSEKWQILPISVNPIAYDESQQILKASGTATLVISDQNIVKTIEVLQFNLWRKPNWKDKNLWKINPFQNNTSYKKIS